MPHFSPHDVERAEHALRDLKHQSRATCATAHFYNRLSNVYWLFWKDGRFRYDAQVSGCITHPSTVRRIDLLERQQPSVTDDSFGTVWRLFNPIETAVAEQGLDADSFAVREQFTKALLLTIGEPGAASQHPAGSDTKLDKVYVLLLYRKNARFPSPGEVNGLNKRFAAPLAEPLLRLLLMPRLGENAAWKLRSFNLRFRQRLADLLIGHGQESDNVVRALYRYVVESVWDIIQPQKGRTTLCSLSLVRANNEVEHVAIRPHSISPNRDSGIVQYVARSGHQYFIPDVARYRRGVSDKSRPRYVAWSEDTQCEMACPLVVQEKVVGVLNLEASEPEAFGAEQLLLLYQCACSIALGVRQIKLWSELMVAFDHDMRLLGAQTPAQVFTETYTTAKDLGFRDPAIWDVERQEWHPPNSERMPRTPPRPDGFTAHIVEQRAAVALADMVKNDHEGVNYQIHRGSIEPNSLLFHSWTLLESFPIALDATIAARVIQSRTVVTHLGFPIFADNGQSAAVRAVLWVNSAVRFLSLSGDECWMLSLLCRSATRALAYLVQRSHAPVRALLTYRFGPRRTDPIFDKLQARPNILDGKLVKEIVVMNVDIRCSKDLYDNCVLARQPDRFVELLQAFQGLVREAVVQHDGVFDKSMGDGAQAIFGVYRPDLIDLGENETLPQSIENAVRTAEAVFQGFHDACQRILRGLVARPPFLGLGVGIAVGEGHVGSLIAGLGLDGIEYSVHGLAPNRAFELQDFARVKTVAAGLKAAKGPDDVRVVAVEGSDHYGRLSRADRRRLAEELIDKCRNICVFDQQARVPGNTRLKPRCYMLIKTGVYVGVATWRPRS